MSGRGLDLHACHAQSSDLIVLCLSGFTPIFQATSGFAYVTGEGVRSRVWLERFLRPQAMQMTASE